MKLWRVMFAIAVAAVLFTAAKNQVLVYDTAGRGYMTPGRCVEVTAGPFFVEYLNTERHGVRLAVQPWRGPMVVVLRW